MGPGRVLDDGTRRRVEINVVQTVLYSKYAGVECKVGLATRPVRVVVLSAGLVFAKGAGVADFELLAPAIYALVGLTAFTVAQRVWHVRGQLQRLAE